MYQLYGRNVWIRDGRDEFGYVHQLHTRTVRGTDRAKRLYQLHRWHVWHDCWSHHRVCLPGVCQGPVWLSTGPDGMHQLRDRQVFQRDGYNGVHQLSRPDHHRITRLDEFQCLPRVQPQQWRLSKPARVHSAAKRRAALLRPVPRGSHDARGLFG